MVVNEQGFQPVKVALRAGTPATCLVPSDGRQDLRHRSRIPVLDIRQALPLKEPGQIEFTPAETGEIAFACGMNMLRDAVSVVQ